MASSTRSPSPNPSRPTTPRNLRTPESSSSIRKSADLILSSSKLSSLSDLNQRNLVSKGFASQKENRGRSPVLSSPSSKGGSKSFMAPTISASSKAVTPVSQRKRILGERNETVRSSLSSNQIEEFLRREESDSAPKAPSTNTTEETQTRDKQPDSVSVPPSSSPHFSVASFDNQADSVSVLPPYDPKTNFLSPRPRFLHYRPNPRIELYRNGEDDLFDMVDVRNLEDSFSSESGEEISVETEKDNDCSQSELKEFEGESALSEVEIETEGVPCEVHLPELELQPNLPELELQPSVRGKRFRFKFASFVLILLLGCLYLPLTDSPVISSPSISSVPAFHSFYRFNAAKHLNAFDARVTELSRRLGQWSNKFFSYFSPIPKEEFNPVPLANFTAVDLDWVSDLDYDFVSPNLNQEEESGDGKTESDYNENRAEESTVVGNETVEKTESEVPVSSIAETVESGPEMGRMEETITVDGETERGEQMEETITVEVDLEKIESEEMEENGLNEREELDLVSKGLNGDQITGSEEPVSSVSESKISMQSTVATIVSFVITCIVSAISALYYRKQRKVLVSTFENTPAKRGITSSVSGSSESHVQNRASLYSTVDMELSSSFNNSPISGGAHLRSRHTGEETSYERRAAKRRESDVSSATSYGSFTTYEKIATKKGNRDEEGMTPIRRSSRIRNLAISP